MEQMERLNTMERIERTDYRIHPSYNGTPCLKVTYAICEDEYMADKICRLLIEDFGCTPAKTFEVVTHIYYVNGNSVQYRT